MKNFTIFEVSSTENTEGADPRAADGCFMGSGIRSERCAESGRGSRRDAKEVEEVRKRRTQESEGRRIVPIRRGSWVSMRLAEGADTATKPTAAEQGLWRQRREKRKLGEKKIVNCQLLGQRRWRARLGGDP